MDGLNLIAACQLNDPVSLTEAIKVAFEGLEMIGGREGWKSLTSRLIAIGDEHM